MTPDASQEFTLGAALGERSDGSWAAFEVADLQPRQNGKGDTIQIRELAGLFLFDERLIIHTAHELSTAVEAFLRIVEVIESSPDLLAMVKRIRYANGEQGVELKSGARLKYKARTGGGGRGFAGASLVVYDEAYALTVEQIAASLPTLSTGVNPQVWYASSAGLATSTALHQLRRRALEGNAGRLAYCEHTAERPFINDEGLVESEPVDEDDEANVALSNPAYLTRISKDYVDAERRAFSAEPGKFARERLGVFDPLPVEVKAKPVKLPASRWKAHVDGGGTIITHKFPVEPGACTLAFSVTPGSGRASISLAAGSLSKPYVECLEDGEGAGWLAARLVELVTKWRPLALGCNGTPPSAAQVGPILAAFDRAKLDQTIVQMSATEYRQGCEGFFVAVNEGTLWRPEDGPLHRAGADAAARKIGEGFGWEQRSEPITPLESATVARALLPAVAASTFEPLVAVT